MYTQATTKLDLVGPLRFGAPASEDIEEIPFPLEIWTGTGADAAR
jgi:hypothetical protein